MILSIDYLASFHIVLHKWQNIINFPNMVTYLKKPKWMYTNAYYDSVNTLLAEATSKQEVLEILEYISNSLKKWKYITIDGELI